MLHRVFDKDFQAAVEPLRVAGAGTETVGPLLAMLVNLVRPQRVLEVGMGYTTPSLRPWLRYVSRLAPSQPRWPPRPVGTWPVTD